MIASQVNLTRSLQIVRQVARLGNLCLGPPITKPSEAITSLALDLPFPTFPSWISSHEIDVTCAAWPMTVNPPPRCSSICPATAIFAEHCFPKERIGVCNEIIRRCLRWYEGLDSLIADFP